MEQLFPNYCKKIKNEYKIGIHFKTMQIPSLAEIKKELNYLEEKEVKELLLELVKFSRENKSFLYFQLYSRNNPDFYTKNIKIELELLFDKSKSNHFYTAKKSIQALRRSLNKALKLTKNKADQADVILFFCEKMKENGYCDFVHPVITNVFDTQIKKAIKLISSLHEDLFCDYESRLAELQSSIYQNSHIKRLE